MSELRAIIVDDEPLARDELAFLLAEVGGVEVVGQASDAHAALELAEREEPDVAFVDLRMPGPDGIALAQALKRRRPNLQVVVVTAHDDAALRAFEAQVLDYVLKPARLERVRSAVERARAVLAPRPSQAPGAAGILERLAVRRGGVYVVLEVADVIYFEMKDELVWAVTASDRVALDLTMTNLEQRLPEGVFFRSHRGALVRVDKIRAMEPAGAGTYELVLDHPESPRVPLARERARLLREKIPFAG
ncbi:MAG TPA: LytTR family DNA-binding domain-containing protein [Polyangiales bacterium]|nr:LytTR family DNA-binding domain-containing protein [Polyangiales bacterium]